MSNVMPEVNTLVDLTLDGCDYMSRVEDFEGSTVWVAAPLGGSVEPPELGSSLAVRWNAGVRGRYVAEARLRSTDRPEGRGLQLWNLTFERSPRVDQRRSYVRAGGGEPVRLEPKWASALSGEVSDIGEGGLRCRLPYGELRTGEPVVTTVWLGDDVLTVDGWVLRTADSPGAPGVDIVVSFDLCERDADLVRRYVMQQQILARRAAADAAH